MGKTAFALNLATNVAVGSKKSVAVFNLEMSSEQLVKRMISTETGIESEKAFLNSKFQRIQLFRIALHFIVYIRLQRDLTIISAKHLRALRSSSGLREN